MSSSTLHIAVIYNACNDQCNSYIQLLDDKTYDTVSTMKKVPVLKAYTGYTDTTSHNKDQGVLQYSASQKRLLTEHCKLNGTIHLILVM